MASTTTETSQKPHDDPENTIHILGLGNIGKYVAHALRKHNPDLPITLLFHKRVMLGAWQKEGQTITSIRQSPQLDERNGQGGFNIELLGNLPKGAKSESTSQGPIRNLIVATKSYRTATAIKPLKHRLDKDSNILFLQNGMGASDKVSQRWFPDQENRPTYYAGICSAGVNSPPEEVFSFIHAGLGPLIVGRTDVMVWRLVSHQAPSPADNSLVRALHEASPTLMTTLTNPTDIYVEQLKKLAINAIINPLTAIFGCRNGEVFGTHQRIKIIKDLISKEIGPTLRTLVPRSLPPEQAHIFDDDQLFATAQQVAEKTAANFSSMLQDTRQGKQTEIDFILGYLSRWAAKRKIPRPQIYRMIGLMGEIKPRYYQKEEGKCITDSGEPFCSFVWPGIDWSKEVPVQAKL
ncbi:ketopantoate reductase PanE/ApbA C terminal-domain-containing protein [Cladorrhinum samala]|uniref:2-dehydropantoate 2-reductase n=1 Tax=Cladorrhinum samala TaxID=585594 RepID=A0AAV9HBG4_9PEZI|nr:ketopantoate reductase PanE/ApbA C terminal-domain-containing protein [Cladorrhinum samala]